MHYEPPAVETKQRIDDPLVLGVSACFTVTLTDEADAEE